MEVLFNFFMAITPLVAVGGALFLGWRYVRSKEQRGISTGEIGRLQERVLQLEESLGAMSQEVERLNESQRFTEHLLAERATGSRPTTT